MLDLADAYQLLHDGKLALTRAERQGIRVDVEYCETESARLGEEIKSIGAELGQSELGRTWGRSFQRKVNYDSGLQLTTVLQTLGVKGLPKTDKGNPKADESVLRGLGIPDMDLLLRWRKLSKIRGTYLAQFMREQIDGYIHPFFNLHLVRSYRSSSSKPNFQNVPARDEEAKRICRNALFPRPGHQLVGVDYSGLEVSIACCYHQDPTMIRYLNDPDSDMHADMADQIFFAGKKKWRGTKEYKVLRYAAKNALVFPFFYGSYADDCAIGLAVQWGELPRSGRWKKGQGLKLPGGLFLADHLADHKIHSLDQFTKHIREIEEDFWGRRFPVYSRWKKRGWKRYQKHGYIEMFTGFRCSGVMRKNEVSNYGVQGAAFHCLLWAFIEVDRIQRKEQWQSRLVGQIHDQLVLDVHPEELSHVVEVIKRVSCVDLLKAWDWITVPLSVEVEISPVDGSWAEMKEVET